MSIRSGKRLASSRSPGYFYGKQSIAVSIQLHLRKAFSICVYWKISGKPYQMLVLDLSHCILSIRFAF